MKVIINNKEVTLYPLKSEDFGLVYKEFTPNGFGGFDCTLLQVLKSAAGYYIGALCCSNYAEKGEYPEYHWEPNFRDSNEYFDTRELAEDAFINGKYSVKFYI
jgi:hypothetical protein